MAKLKFDVSKIRELFNKIGDDSRLTIVGDQGVYIMAFDEPMPRTIVYAEGCNPDVDEDWFDVKGRTFGYDDGGDDFGTKAELSEIVGYCKKHFVMNISPTQLSCETDVKVAKKPDIDMSQIPDSLKEKLGLL